jgi:uncharacterized coiled-coil protein SlyX
MNDSDDYDFTPSASSNLASLFDSSSINSDSSSLIYTAPKQPKQGITSDVKSETTKGESTVVCAYIVHVWKLVEGKYIPLGKHGLAIISSSLQASYDIILYKEKRNVIMRTKIDSTFEISIKKDDFASFFDSVKDNWLIKFSSNNDFQVLMDHMEKYGGTVIMATEIKENSHTTENEKEDNEKSIAANVENGNTLENKAKADILSRIAKMGQSILPSKNADVEEQIESAHINVSTHAVEEKINESKPINTFPSALSPSHVFPQTQIQNIPSGFVIGQAVTYDPLNLYVTENRAHNTEVRMSLSHISEKLNTMMKLMDTEKARGEPNSEMLKSKIKVLELRTENLLKELTFFQEENIKLKLQMKDQQDRLRNEEQNKADASLAKEQEKIKELETELASSKDNIMDLSKISEKQKVEVEELKNKLTSCQDIQLNEIFKRDNTIEELKQKLHEFENQQHGQSSDQDNKEKSANFTAMLKESMNGMYGNIVASFNEGQQYQFSEISNVIAQNIKFTTLKIIQSFQQTYENLSDTS